MEGCGERPGLERLGTTVRLSHEVRDKHLLKLWIVLSWEMKLKNFLASPRTPSRRAEGLCFWEKKEDSEGELAGSRAVTCGYG